MTNAIHTVRTVTEHRFIVPCEGPWGGDIGTFTDAMAWARKAAEDAGINTSSDDWLRLRCEDDQLVLTLTVEGGERNPDAEGVR